MKALCWHGKHKVTVDEVPDSKIEHPQDAIIRVTSSAICGSDLHIYNGLILAMEKGDVLGHETMGEVIEVGAEVRNLQVGDRVVVPFTIACGECFFCRRSLFSCCDTTNPDHALAEKLSGHSPAGLFGYSHILGGYPGGQAEYLRVPFADVGPIKVPDHLTDEQVLFLSDIFPTGYMAAENCNIQPGDTIAVWGAGPVGQFVIRSAFLLGAGRVIAIDKVPERLRLAEAAGAETLDFQDDEDRHVLERLNELTAGRGPDACIDAVGMEAHGTSPGEIYDWVKMGLRLATDRPNVLRQAIQSCRKGGTVSVPGVYAGFLDKIPFGAAMNKGLTIKSGQTHVQRYTRPLLELIEGGKIDPSFVVTHTVALDAAPEAYETFKQKEDGCIKVVLKPHESAVRLPALEGTDKVAA